jgi:putative transposase
MYKAYKYRLYPNKQQKERLQWILDQCRELYNACLQERKEAYESIKRHPNYYDPEWRKQAMKERAVSWVDQSRRLTEIQETVRPEYKDIRRAILTDVLQRLDKAFQAFFRRVKAGEKAGYPRYQGKGRYDSFTTSDTGSFSLTADERLAVAKIGAIKVKLHRPIEGQIKICTVKREGERWYVVLTCEVEHQIVYHHSIEAVGIDLGLLHFATLSDGSIIENLRYLRASEQKLQKLQQALARKKRGSHRRKKAVKAVANVHRKIRNQRRDFHQKAACKLVNRYSLIVFEDLQVTNLSKRPKAKQGEDGTYLPNGAKAKAGLNKSILDAGWHQFMAICENKAASAGSRLVKVDPRRTSQICSGCGAIIKKDLSDRRHVCACGVDLDRDHNAALNERAGTRITGQLATDLEPGRGSQRTRL